MPVRDDKFKKMDETLVEEMHHQNVVRTTDNRGNRMDEDVEHGAKHHDSKKYGDTETVEFTDVDSAEKRSEVDKYSHDSLKDLSQDERHSMLQDAHNEDPQIDPIAQLAGDRRGMRTDS